MVRDLQCELLGGNNDHSACVGALGIFHLHQNRKKISCSFTRTGLRNADHFLPAKDKWDGFLLDIGRRVEPRFSNSIQQLTVEIKTFKR
jgi:hypothetical protein